MRFAEDADGVLAGKNLRPQGELGAIADEQNQVLWVADVVFQMMPDATGFAHARGADDDSRFFQVVQPHRMRDLTDVRQISHAKWIFLFAQKSGDGIVETFR